jgi:hypothetical protein
MGIAFRSDEESGLSVSVWVGMITPADVHRHLTALERDQNWGAGGSALTDLSGVSEASRPTPERLLNAANEFTTRLGSRLQNGCWAIVGGPTFAEANRFAAYLEEEVGEMWVFEDLVAAAEWLGYDNGVVARMVADVREDLEHPSH